MVVGLAAVAVLAVSIGAFAAAHTPDGQAESTPAAAETIDSAEPPVALQTPVALLKHPDYYAPVGQEIRFDTSDSYSPNGQLASYEWDFNGDGVFDESTAIPIVTHTYGGAGEWTMRVR